MIEILYIWEDDSRHVWVGYMWGNGCNHSQTFVLYGLRDRPDCQETQLWLITDGFSSQPANSSKNHCKYPCAHLNYRYSVMYFLKTNTQKKQHQSALSKQTNWWISIFIMSVDAPKSSSPWDFPSWTTKIPHKWEIYSAGFKRQKGAWYPSSKWGWSRWWLWWLWWPWQHVPVAKFGGLKIVMSKVVYLWDLGKQKKQKKHGNPNLEGRWVN